MSSADAGRCFHTSGWIGSHDEDPRIAQQLDCFDAFVVDGQEDKRSVELAAAQHLDVVIELDVLPERERSAVGLQRAHDIGQERLRDTLECADTQASHPVLLELLDVRAGGAQPRVDRARVLDETLTLECKRDLARAANPRDQTDTDQPFERRNLPADRRLAVPRLRRSRTERAFGRDRLERGEMTKLDSLPTAGIDSHTDLNAHVAASVVRRRKSYRVPYVFQLGPPRRQPTRDCEGCRWTSLPWRSGCGTTRTSCVGGPTVLTP
jgi:hypothetical protein